MIFVMGVKKLFRERRSSALWIISLGLLLSVVCVFSIALLTQTIDQVIFEQAGKLLSADRIIRSSEPIPENLLNRFKKPGVRFSKATNFASMISVEGRDEMQLVSVRAVDLNYPLKGHFLVGDFKLSHQEKIQFGPSPGTIWVEPRLADLLNLTQGDTLTIGYQTFRVEKLLYDEPERSVMLLGTILKVIISQEDVAATEVIQPGSRASYEVFLTANRTQLADLDHLAETSLPKGARYLKAQAYRTSVQNILSNLNAFLDLTAIANCLIAAMVIFSAGQIFYVNNLKTVGLYKTFGLTSRKIQGIYGVQITLLAVGVLGLGIVLGYVLQTQFVQLLENELPLRILTLIQKPLVLSIGVCMILLLGVVFPTVVQLNQFSPEQLFHQVVLFKPKALVLSQALGILAFLILFYAFFSEIFHSVVILAAIFGFGIVLYGLIFGILSVLSTWPFQQKVIWRLAFSRFITHPHQGALQVLVFTWVIAILITFHVISGDLLTKWQKQLPQQTPNYFLVNLAEKNRNSISDFFNKNEIQSILYPIVRGRLVAINEESVRIDLEQTNKRKGIARPLNLTETQTLPIDNQILEGAWFEQVQNPSLTEISIERDFAKRLKIKLGDKLTFLIGDQQLIGFVTSVRSVDWTSFNPNFFIIFPKKTFQGYGITYMSSFYLPQKKEFLANQLMRQYKEISVLDIKLILNRIKNLLNKGTLIVKILWLVSFLFSVLLLLSLGLLSVNQRASTNRILKRLGASCQQIRKINGLEYGVMGILSCVLGGSVSALLYYYVSQEILNL